MGNQPTYDIFLSYNSLDRDLVLKVAKELKRRECSSFVDQWYLKPGRDWVEALERALAGSRSVAVFIGPHAMGRWQQRERVWALDQSTKHDDFPVIPVLLPGCEPPLGFLEQFMWIDLRDDPSDARQLDVLAAAIRGQEVDFDGLRQPQAMVCPYRGLLTFREEDAAFFFGRDDYRERLFEIVKRNPLVAVVGASGSGKSSLVSAGLVPELRKQSAGPVWDVVRMVPNVDPLYSLAESLVPLIEPELSGLAFEQRLGEVANDLENEQPKTPLWGLVNAMFRKQSGTERVVLFVDQWEELYTNCEKPHRRERFVAELLEATSRKDSPLSVVLTVRGDFYNEILKDRPLVDRLQAGRLDLGPMDAAELRSVIVGPAKNVGLTFEHGLADRILKEAGEEPGRLALLEFALKELWERRDGTQLTHAGYEDLGRQPRQDQATGDHADNCLSQAIATYAEGVYSKLDPEERELLPSLFRRLVRAGTSPEQDTRRRASLSELDDAGRVVARKLSDARLLMTTLVESGGQSEAQSSGEAGEDSESTGETGNDQAPSMIVEVAHEELLRRWGRLKQWINEDRAFLLWRSRLDLKVEEYQRDGAAALFYGRPLQESKQYYPVRAADLEQDHRGFLDASLKSARHKRALKIGGFFALLVIAAIAALGWYNYDRHQDSETWIASLLTGTAGAVPICLEELEDYRNLAIPRLHEEFSGVRRDKPRPPQQRVHAVYALIRFSAVTSDELQFLLDSIATLPKDEGENLVAALALIHERDSLKEELGRRVDQASSDSERNRYLSVSLSLGVTDRAKAICKLKEDPSARTALIHGFKEFPGDIARLANTLKTTDSDLQSALCVAIGTLRSEAADSTGAILQQLYTDTTYSGGTHSAAGWALRQQGRQRDDVNELARQASSNNELTSDWYVNVQGMTMLKVPGGMFRMGKVDDDENPSDDDKAESFDSIWMSDREVSVGQFQAFVEATKNQIGWEGQDVRFSPTEHHPVQQVSWYDAIEYCNWLTAEENKSLSKEQQLRPYYELAEIKREKEGEPILSAVVKELGGKGYRLPTDREWEYACRAISTQNYCYGNDPLLLASYGVFQSNLTQVIGQKMPNGWGLFDMHGNVWEWCWDKYDSESRVLRGGSFDDFDPQLLRSADRGWFTPDDHIDNVGFRISRTP